jgi:aminoglycoside/choline kinase family phosphotransferase
MQVRSFADFKTDWCWDSPKYDQKIMLERESGYFLQALCSDMLKIPVDRQPVEREFEDLADLAGQAEANFFLHRDFQSRNIMIKQGKAHFIDYQAGRLGPLGYDLASLLVDPYAALPAGMQDGLVACYLDELTQLVPYDKEQFKKEYLVLSLQRNLQILGAFAFLSHRRGKPFFQQYIKPALHSLQTNLARVPHEDYPFLNGLVEQCLTIV